MAAGATPAPHRVFGNGLDVFRITWCNRVAVWLAMSLGKWRAGKHTLLHDSGKLFGTALSRRSEIFPEPREWPARIDPDNACAITGHGLLPSILTGWIRLYPDHPASRANGVSNGVAGPCPFRTALFRPHALQHPGQKNGPGEYPGPNRVFMQIDRERLISGCSAPHCI